MKEKKYLKAILDNSPASIVLIGKNHEVLAFNKTISQVLFQYHNRKIKEGDLYYPDFVIESNKALYLEAFHSAINGKPFKVQNYTENQNISYWFEYEMHPVYDGDILLGVTLSAQEITEKKKLERALIESEERFRRITTIAPVGILITNQKFEIQFANLYAKNMLGYLENELYSLSISQIIQNFKISNEQKLRVDELNLDIESPVFNQEQFLAITKNSSTLQIMLSSSMFLNQNELFLIFIIQDLTELSHKDNIIAEQNNKLRDIAWYQSHIIRAPLARIMGLVALLDDNTIDEKEREYFCRSILKNTNELDKVIHEIAHKTV